MTYNKVNPKQSFPELEEEILKFWSKENIFEESIENRKTWEEFNFYDGPPFATGTPHYGHILAWTIKDVIPRYQTMLWKKVERKFGWDTHWLPIENIVEKKLKISWKDDIEKLWVHAFNEECRKNVFWYVDEWKKTVKRMWRWVDMEDDYKTMDTDFMESVWWVFKTIYDKWLIYEWNRVVPYCPRCTTPLSNFEVNQGYKDKQDKTVTVKFKVKWNESKYILAWTTTPWTLPANLGLAVWKDILYSEILDKKTGETYVLASDLLVSYYKNEEDYTLVREYKWECLAWIKYEALFGDFDIQLNEMWNNLWTWVNMWENAYSVVIGHHVTTESGTGIVHIAPAYWEDDNLIWKEQNLGFVTHINDTWKTYNLLKNNDLEISAFNDIILKDLKDRNLAVLINTINHSYPHCWRCETPLIYRAISAWYVSVEKIRDKIVANNLKTNWTPENIKTWRFGKWLEWAKDWNISRNRYWGSAMPVWQSEDKKSEVVIGSIEELYEANKEYGQIEKKDDKYFYTNTGEEVDIHKHFVDEIFVKNENNFEAKNVLWVHGWTSEGIWNWKKWNWLDIQNYFKQDWITFDVPSFDSEKETSYKKWKETLDWIDINKYDTIIATSFWCPVIMQYICENNIKLKRLVLVAPSWLKWNPYLEKIIPEITEDNTKVKSLVTEIIITHSKDDQSESAPFWYWEQLSKDLEASFIPINWVWHNFSWWNFYLLSSLTKNWTPLKRIPEVLDCWFESGAMPYASKHYPFENKEEFKFPADFIAEWLDQTRGWFYTLVILSTALFDSPAAMNTIVNGIILAEDGKKMSKSLNNYPAPKLIFNKYWADAMRFYLMNSPVVEAQDMRFTENWVEEVVKKVILPLWNTYSFFTTYANIDEFEVEKWNIFYVRHWETDNNKNGIVNGGNDDIDINERWIEQAHKTWKSLKNSWTKFDVIVTSPMIRAKHTSKIIREYIWDELNIDIIDSFREMDFWKFKAKKLSDISKENNLKNDEFSIWEHILTNTNESIDDFKDRVQDWYNQIKEKYRGKNVLLVWHAWTHRALKAKRENITDIWKYCSHLSPKNASITNLSTEKSNPLDKWIFSELHKLINEVWGWLDNYRINDATKNIPAFMDNLTNWYIRRSRKRFWKSENDFDKIEAYNTLHDVLVIVSKLIAPFMPFIAENIYQNLTNKKSVHLSDFPKYDKNLVNNELSEQMDKTKKIINLWLAWRVNHKLKVRQPLKSVTIWEDLEEYYKNILKEELNVKEVIVVDWSTLAKKVCKPKWRNIWPKFGKDVKFIMSEAKNGNFEELESSNVKVWDFELENDDFELVFEASDSKYEIEAWFGMVIALDPELTTELKQEAVARDLVRFIQDSRKEASFNVEDRIELSIVSNDSELPEVLEKFWQYIEKETLSTIKPKIENPDFNNEIDIYEKKIQIWLKK